MAAQLVQGKLCKKPQLYASFWQRAYCICYSELALISDPVSAFYRAVAGIETSIAIPHYTRSPRPLLPLPGVVIILIPTVDQRTWHFGLHSSGPHEAADPASIIPPPALVFQGSQQAGKWLLRPSEQGDI